MTVTRYILEPVDQSHPDWEASSHKDRCRVTAPDEKAARNFADYAFRQATRRRADLTIPMSPWTNPERVECRESGGEELSDSRGFPPLVEVPDYPSAPKTMGQWGALDDVSDIATGATWTEYPKSEYLESAVMDLRNDGHSVDEFGGLINEAAAQISDDEIDDSESLVTDSAQVVVGGDKVVVGPDPTAGTAPEFTGEDGFDRATGGWGQGKFGEGTWGGGAPLGAPLSAATESPEVVVSRVKQNPNHYRMLATSLVAFIDDVDSGSLNSRDTNAHPLWGNAENADELTALLREVRDELRRFNDLIESGAESAQLAESTAATRSKLLQALGAIANSTFGKTVQIGLASLVLGYGYTLALALGVPPLDPTVAALIKNILPDA